MSRLRVNIFQNKNQDTTAKWDDTNGDIGLAVVAHWAQIFHFPL